MKRRNLLEMFLLTLITCGFYQIYWLVTAYGELATENGESDGIILNVILFFLTCGLWSIYLIYKMGGYLNEIEVRRGYTTIRNTTIPVLFAIFAGYAAYYIIQDRVNFMIDNPRVSNDNTQDNRNENNLLNDYSNVNNNTQNTSSTQTSNTQNNSGGINFDKKPKHEDTTQRPEVDPSLISLNNMFADDEQKEEQNNNDDQW